jgi:hypothetical protein
MQDLRDIIEWPNLQIMDIEKEKRCKVKGQKTYSIM